MSKKLFTAALVAITLFATGCRTAQVMDVNDAPVHASNTPSEAAVFKAITAAGTSLGWIIKKEAPGHATGTLLLRDHKAVVDINYSSTKYSIEYKDSANLKYDVAKNTIHANYNGWVQNLNNAIAVRLGNL